MCGTGLAEGNFGYQHCSKCLRLESWKDGSAIKALATLPEGLSSVPNTYIKYLTTACNFNSRDLTPSSGLWRYLQQHTHIHTIKKKKNKPQI